MKKILTFFSAVALISFFNLPTAKADEVIVPEEPMLISEQAEVCNNDQGMIVKRADINGQSFSTLFVVGCHDTIHIFPNEQIYKTWWPNFEDLSYVSGAFIASKELENNVTARPGTYLIKQSTSPKVYAIESGSILRWIPDEITAEALYGKNWNKIIIDISDELFSDYSVGSDLTVTAYPNNIMGYLPDGRVVYLNDNSYYNLPGDTIGALRLNNAFLVPLSATIMATYTDGGDLVYDEMMAFPF